MREIKLWDKKQKKFLTKFYCFYKDGYFEFYNNDRDFKNGIMNTNVVVVESTGLKNKNGVDIYEGDIIKYSFGGHRYKGLVTYSNENAMFEIKDGAFRNNLGFALDIEVIGNIYENPELLN